MTEWEGSTVAASDRKEAMDNFSPSLIDPEFLPFVETINEYPFAVTVQCCIGHMPYEKWQGPKSDWPDNHSERWGYLQLMLSFEAADWLCQRVDSWEWFWAAGSDVIRYGDAGVPMTDAGSCKIAFAWDASRWPVPAEDIVRSLREFHEDQSDIARDA